MIYRKHKGKEWPAAKKNGHFVLGDPKFGDKKHLVTNEVLVFQEVKAVELIVAGFSIRIETDTRPSLIRKNLYHGGKRLT
ncbi:hypothetical protein [uncultured Sulfitobacter sp.]|uniref:hypothetical protein n=1 Tax=uncultured Sulfitobacter sp. TaxID=191468 RepID=UPI0030FCC40C